jgi:hypothetical protein
VIRPLSVSLHTMNRVSPTYTTSHVFLIVEIESTTRASSLGTIKA